MGNPSFFQLRYLVPKISCFFLRYLRIFSLHSSLKDITGKPRQNYRRRIGKAASGLGLPHYPPRPPGPLSRAAAQPTAPSLYLCTDCSIPVPAGSLQLVRFLHTGGFTTIKLNVLQTDLSTSNSYSLSPLPEINSHGPPLFLP